MTVEEYNKMHEAKGTPKVWVVESCFPGGNISSDLFLKREEAFEKYKKIPDDWFKNMYRTWDIWGFTEKQRQLEKKKRVGIKRGRLKLSFEKERNEYEKYTDDRRVFCNIYDMIMESLDVMETVDNDYIWCAFYEKYNEDFATLKEIKERFQKAR